MQRREFIKYFGAGAVSFSVLNVFSGSSDAAEKDKFNIIYILADDLGYGELGCYGQELIKTPNIDKLASEGMKFTDHYSGSALCAPARCVLMTGKHTGHCHIRNNKPLAFEGNEPIPAGEITIAEILKKAGYTTGCIGKWGLGYPGSEGDPVKQGFDYFYGYNCQRQAHEYYPEHLWRNTEKVILKGNLNGQKKEYSHDLFAEEALKFIKENRSKPFFLYLPFTIPHPKNQVPELGEYKDKDWSENCKIHAAMISRLDRDTGRIMSLLDELGIEGKTVLLFASDNGPNGGVTLEKFNAAGVLRSKKGSLYEGGIRVPLIVRCKGRIKAGSVSNHVSGFQDMLPTFAELAGAEVPKGIDGLPMLDVLEGRDAKQKKHEYMYWELGMTQAVRKGDLKAVRRNAARGGKIELYDLKKDISEKEDIADIQPLQAKEMLRIMNEAHVESDLFRLFTKKKK